MQRDDRQVLWVLLGLCSVYSSLLLLTDLLPFVDLPYHLAEAAVVRGYGDAANRFSEFYLVHLVAEPNVLHILFCSLPIFPSVEFANKVYLALYTFLFPLSVYALIRAVRGNTWFALLSFLYLYSYSTHWGFISFISAIPAIFFLFALVVRHFERPNPWTYVAVMIGSFLLFFIHVLASIFFALAFGLACLAHLARDRKVAVRSIPLIAPLACMVVVWWIGANSDGESTLFGFLSDYYGGEYFVTWRERILLFSRDNMFIASGRLGMVLGLVLAAATAAYVIWAAFFERAALVAGLREERLRPVLALFVASALCYYFLPGGLPGQWSMYQRFSVFVALALIVITSAVGIRRLRPSWVKVAILATCLFHVALYAEYFSAFSEDSADFTDQLLPEDRRTRLAGLAFEAHYRGVPAYLHFGSYFIVRRQGIAPTHMVDTRYGAIRRNGDLSVLPELPIRIDTDPRYDGELDVMDWLLIHGKVPPEIQPLLHKFREVRRQGRWTLLEKI